MGRENPEQHQLVEPPRAKQILALPPCSHGCSWQGPHFASLNSGKPSLNTAQILSLGNARWKHLDSPLQFLYQGLGPKWVPSTENKPLPNIKLEGISVHNQEKSL